MDQGYVTKKMTVKGLIHLIRTSKALNSHGAKIEKQKQLLRK